MGWWVLFFLVGGWIVVGIGTFMVFYGVKLL